jgi:hypothetical protein
MPPEPVIAWLMLAGFRASIDSSDATLLVTRALQARLRAQQVRCRKLQACNAA